MKTSIDYVSGLKIIILLITIINIYSITDIKNDKDIDFIKTSTEVILPSIPKIVKNNETTNINSNKNINVNNTKTVLRTYYGNVSHYGPDCKGCSGKTSTGYNVNNGNIYYNDKSFGVIRIVAGDNSLPFGTIIRIVNNNKSIIGIVLDRGRSIGFNKKYAIDLLSKNEQESLKNGVLKNSKIEILRYGF